MFTKMAVRMGAWILVFLTAFMINSVITKFFFSSTNYLTEQVRWGTIPFSDVLWGICGHIASVLLGRNQFYSIFYGMLFVCSLALFVATLWKYGKNNKSGCITAGIFYLAMQTTPFLMTLLQGGEPVLRSQLVLPAMTGFQFMLNIWMVKQLGISLNRVRQVLLVCVVLLGFMGGMKTAKITWSFYYTDQLRYEQDKALGQSLIERIEQVCNEEETEGLPVVVVGRRPFQRNNSCMQGQVMGFSLFDWDTMVEPRPYHSTKRILGFLHTLGADYLQAPIDRMEEALAYSENMPTWPSEGSVQVKNAMVIVKLSDYE